MKNRKRYVKRIIRCSRALHYIIGTIIIVVGFGLFAQAWRQDADFRKWKSQKEQYAAGFLHRSPEAEQSEELSDTEAETEDASYERKAATKKEKRKTKQKRSAPEVPDGADCYIEIPSISFENIVFSGKAGAEAMEQHFLKTAVEDMEYGSGAYVIFGHQSRNYGQDCNRLEQLKIGATINVYDRRGKKHVYCVTHVMKNRKKISEDDFKGGTDKLAIYTCMKQDIRPKPYLVVRAVKE